MTRIFRTGTFVSGSWLADVIRIEGPGGPKLNPRVRPHDHGALAGWLRAIIPLEMGRVVSAILESHPWRIEPIPERLSFMGATRDGWTLLPYGPDWSWMLARDGDEACAVDPDLLLRCLELYSRAILPVFDGLAVATKHSRPGKAPPWVGMLRDGHARLTEIVGDDRFERIN